MSGRLLPSSVGFYTRAIAEANDTHGRLSAVLAIIPEIGRTVTPPAWLPWVLRDRGLEPLMPYVEWQVLLDEGAAWLRIRGTPQASVTALGWIGWPVVFECGPVATYLYDHYHIHLPAVPDRATLERIIAVEHFAKSADSVFFRLVHGRDVRKVHSAHTRMGRHIWGRDSGVDLRPDWPRLSFVVQGEMRAVAAARAVSGVTLTIGARALRAGDVITSRSRLPARAVRGPALGVALGDSAHAAAGAGADARDMLRPLAGVVGGRSIIGRRQTLYIAMQQARGTRPMLAAHRTAGAFALPTVRQLMAVPAPIRLDARVDAGARATAADALPPLGRLTALTPASAAARFGVLRDRPQVEQAAVSLASAPWSALPWGEQSWGESPAAEFFISEGGE